MAAMPHVLLIEDDLRLAEMASALLGGAGFQVSHQASLTAGLTLLRSDAAQHLSALVLDLSLPDGDGLDLCRQLRALPGPVARLPVLMLTARGDPMDRVIGLEIGADDYLPKPFEPRELLARLRALLRRSQASVAGVAPSDLMHFGRLDIDLASRTVRLDGAERPLTAYQFDLLVAMARHPGRVLSREFLMDAVKGTALEAFDRSIDVHVGKIRAAIEDDVKSPRRILTIRGSGYVFAKAQD
jgi:DNA-binding response OmpR family regulator